jgi:hypothetical protein
MPAAQYRLPLMTLPTGVHGRSLAAVVILGYATL